MIQQKYLYDHMRLFASFFLLRKYLFRSFDLFIMAFLKFLVMKLELFAHINFYFLWHACQVLINSNRWALFKSIFNNSLLSSLWNTWLSKFLKLLYWIICFLLKTFKTVMTILWKSDIPVSKITVFVDDLWGKDLYMMDYKGFWNKAK